MPLYTFLHNLLNVLAQIANKMGFNKKNFISLKKSKSTAIRVTGCAGGL
jgi:predicted house-cleaning noncanonical NTP pyrophosphatase (MazG superfamily)